MIIIVLLNLYVNLTLIQVIMLIVKMMNEDLVKVLLIV